MAVDAEVRLHVEHGLARITLCRPPLNILTTSMLLELGRALDRAGADATVRIVKLDAEGKAFSAGVDVGDHVGLRVEPMMDALATVFTAFARLEQPTVAVVRGAALGGGCELVLGTDLCWAAEGATFGQPEVRLGLFAPPASVLLPRLIGERRALGLLLTGDTISAAEAERIGLVNHVLAEATFDAEVERRLARLLALSGSALKQVKGAVRTALAEGAGAHQALHRRYLDQLMATADATEGLSAFLAKRPPEWRHR